MEKRIQKNIFSRRSAMMATVLVHSQNPQLVTNCHNFNLTVERKGIEFQPGKDGSNFNPEKMAALRLDVILRNPLESHIKPVPRT